MISPVCTESSSSSGPYDVPWKSYSLPTDYEIVVHETVKMFIGQDSLPLIFCPFLANRCLFSKTHWLFYDHCISRVSAALNNATSYCSVLSERCKQELDIGSSEQHHFDFWYYSTTTAVTASTITIPMRATTSTTTAAAIMTTTTIKPRKSQVSCCMHHALIELSVFDYQ